MSKAQSPVFRGLAQGVDRPACFFSGWESREIVAELQRPFRYNALYRRRSGGEFKGFPAQKRKKTGTDRAGNRGIFLFDGLFEVYSHPREGRIQSAERAVPALQSNNPVYEPSLPARADFRRTIKEIRMSDALPLPPRPNLEQYRKLAKDLQRACKSADPEGIRVWALRWQETLFRLQGREATPELGRGIERDAERIEQGWRKFQLNQERAGRCPLADAQFFIARWHGFASWPKFAAHLEALAEPKSSVSAFEEAVDAVVAGDLESLDRLLRENPGLARARSTRDHRSTLLHYVSANGVEDFRQRTPRNIVAIAGRLLEAGADVNAESDAYGGRSMTLGLTATSWRPADAGVQIALMDLLIGKGAVIDGPDAGSAVNGCLHNGRREAAEYFASRGAALDLEAAAGVGRLDVVKSFFTADGRLTPAATPDQMKDGYTWACEFGRTEIVEFLLDRGVEVNARLRHHGGTGLHWAAFEGHAGVVRLLLDRGASVDLKDDSFQGTPLEWGLYGWGAPGRIPREGFYEVVAILTKAGGTADPAWFEDDEDRRAVIQNLRSDARMQTALGESRLIGGLSLPGAD